jgi:hypothetical protein
MSKSDSTTLTGDCSGFWSVNNGYLQEDTHVNLKCNTRLQSPNPIRSYIESKRFYYGFTTKFQTLVLEPAKKELLAGNFKIDEVNELLLVPGAESAATGTELGHVDYNAAAKILTGQASLSVKRLATFRKQPDGEGVLESF